MAVRGDEAYKIMQRCGHRSFMTTMLYVREGEAIREGFGEPFPPPELWGSDYPEYLRQTGGNSTVFSGVDGTRTRGLRRDRPAL